MSSIYNDDMAIRNDNKGTNNMSNSNTEQVSRTASEAECDRFNAHFCERRGWSHFYSADVADYHQWCSEFRQCGLTRLADRVAAIRLDGCDRDEFTPAEQADLELAEIALRNLSTETTGQDDQREDRASLQAAVDAVSIERDDWQTAALEATDQRDDLRALLASRDTEIDQLRAKVRDLERTVLYLANTAAYVDGANRSVRDTEEQILEERRMRERCQAERQPNENGVEDDDGIGYDPHAAAWAARAEEGKKREEEYRARHEERIARIAAVRAAGVRVSTHENCPF